MDGQVTSNSAGTVGGTGDAVRGPAIAQLVLANPDRPEDGWTLVPSTGED